MTDSVRDNGRRGKHIFECFKSSLTLRYPRPGLTLLGKVKKWTCNLKKPQNELVIEVPKTEEGLNILDIVRYQPLYNICNLTKVHAKCIVIDNKSQEFE